MIYVQNKGYTIPELFVIIIVVGIFSIFLINKASYAFENISNATEETERMILIKTSTDYAKSIIETLKEEDQYITGKDLVEAKYLVDDDNIYTNVKLKLSYDTATDSPKVEILD